MVKPISFRIVWDKKALDHFKEILTYLEEKSDQAPKIVKNTIIDKLELIKLSPQICETDKLKDQPNKDFRAFIVFNYRVSYQIIFETKEIRVLRIRHTSREPLGYE